MTSIERHRNEALAKLSVWREKPVLRSVYEAFYRRVLALIDPELEGPVLEIGAGVGNLKSYLPGALASDLFPHPWCDVACDAYELPFRERGLSHVLLFDVFHHLETPRAFLREVARVLCPGGRLLVFDPYISLASYPVYGLLHHEPVALLRPIDLGDRRSQRHDYYAAQGNATRLFFSRRVAFWAPDWKLFHAEAFSSFSYLLSGGFSRGALYPESRLATLQALDDRLSRWPRLFGARCLLGLERKTPDG